MPPGFLAVASQPSSQLPLEEYHAWYEEEHIPLRLNKLSAFLSGARYYAIDLDVDDSEKIIRPRSGWLAMYEIDDTRTFEAEEYTGLRLRRSEREKGVMSRIEVLTRKTGEVLGTWGAPEGLDVRETTGLRVGKPSEWVVTHGLDINAEEHGSEGPRLGLDDKAKVWVDEAAERVKKTQDGWIRTRLVKVLEGGKTKMGVSVQQEEEEGMKYFVIHEFSIEKTASSPETKGLIAGRVGPAKVGDWRVWKLYKAYPCIAQRNI